MPVRYRLFAALAAATVVLDQVTKYWARHALVRWIEGRAVASPATVIDGYFDFRLSYNTGSAFGLFAGMGGARVWLSLVGVIACVAIFLVLRKATDQQKWLTSALALVAGGAVGNVIDRALFGKVTDFVVWKIGRHEWPAFNVADAALVAGVLILFLDIGKDQRRAREESTQGGGAAPSTPKAPRG